MSLDYCVLWALRSGVSTCMSSACVQTVCYTLETEWLVVQSNTEQFIIAKTSLNRAL